MTPRYRAWDKETKMMIEISLIDFEMHVIRGTHWKFGETESIKFNDIELIQSTDMVDRNGNIIFEGDIVKMSKDVYSEPTYYEVVRHRGGAYRLESIQHGCELWLRHTDCKVVGNVYENSELLEDKE
jgi:uncharacterized phage protein (TIGR01671 family)